MNTNKILATGLATSLGWLMICGTAFAWIAGSRFKGGVGLAIGTVGLFIYFKYLIPKLSRSSDQKNSKLANASWGVLYGLTLLGNAAIVILLSDNFRLGETKPIMLLNLEFIGSSVILILFLLFALLNRQKIQ